MIQVFIDYMTVVVSKSGLFKGSSLCAWMPIVPRLGKSKSTFYKSTLGQCIGPKFDKFYDKIVFH